MNIYIYILGALALAIRVNRWIASCGAQRGGSVAKLRQQSAGRTRNMRVLFFVLSLDRSRQQRKIVSLRRSRDSPERSKIDEKSLRDATGLLLGVPGPPRDATGTVGRVPGTLPGHPGTPRSAPRAAPERSREVPGRSEIARERSPDGPE